MAKRKKRGIFSWASDLFAAYLKRITDLLHLAALEAQLAIKSLVVISMLTFLLSSIITVTWLSLLGLVFFYLTSIAFSSLAACSVVVGLNIIVLFLIFYFIYRLKENLFFPSTRHQLQPFLKQDDIEHERITTQN